MNQDLQELQRSNTAYLLRYAATDVIPHHISGNLEKLEGYIIITIEGDLEDQRGLKSKQDKIHQ